MKNANARNTARRKLGWQASAVVGVLAMMAGQPAWSAPGTSESQLSLAAANRNLAKGDTAAAVIELKNAVRADPSNSDARYQLAVLYFAQGNAEGALAELESARGRGYDPEKVMPLLAQVYGALGRHRDVLTKTSPDGLTGDAKAAVLATQARANLAQDDKPAARRLVDEALATSPRHGGAILASALLYLAEGKLREAEVEIDKADSNAGQADFLILKSELRQKQGDLDGALTHLNGAVVKFPGSVAARIQRAHVNIARADVKSVQQDVDWILENQPQHPLGLFLKAYLLATAKKYREASQTLLALPNLLERYAPAMYLLGETTLQEGRMEIAQEYAQRYANNMPNDPQGQKLLARVHSRTNNPERAVAVLEPLAARFPNDNALKLQLAGAMLESGRSQDAVALFRQGLAADPTNADAQLALAVGQLQTGETDQAIAQIEKSVQAAPASVQTNTLLVLTHLQLNQPEKAAAAAAAMVAANPTDANAHNLQGTVHLAINDFSGARKAFQLALAKDARFMPAALNLARVEERAGNRDAAAQWYQKAIGINATNLTAYSGLANLALRAGDVDKAVDYLKQAAARNATSLEPRLRLVDVLLDRNRLPQALIEAREIANIAPTSPQALDVLARAQLANGDVESGLSSYQRLAAQSPDNPEVHRRLGRAYMSVFSKTSKGPDAPYVREAREAFDQAVRIAPNDLAALADRIEFERLLAGPPAALTLAQAYASASPDSVSRMIVLGDTQLIAGQAPAAPATYRRAWEKSQSNITLVRHYAGLTQTGQNDAGLKLLKDWTARHPADYDVRFLISNHYIKAGKSQEAITETEALSAAFPENPALLNNLAWLYTGRDNAKALELAEKAYVLAPQSADILDTLGWLRVANADIKGGEELLRKAHEIAPSRSDIGFHYAVALEKSNKSAEAKAVLQRALANNPKFSERTQAQALFDKLSAVR